ncbi:MAG TPA: hypothetical protein VG326_18560 [Tepidisphaeraceae bacterium]|jgi:glycosyltransferase involved in cell wall biosynthesis|nr:hypothetical protein [Tepidisphaeraceae bacterium]
MIRVLHLLGHTPDFETERGAAVLAKNAGANYSIDRRTIGPGGDYRHSLLAAFLLRRRIGRDVDVVHAWGEGARIAAVAAGARQIVFSPGEFPTPRHILRLKHALTISDVRIACSSQSLRRAYLSAGITEDRLTLIRPAVEMPSAPPARDAGLRRALGFCDGDYVILAPGESTRSAGHRDTLWAASVLHVLDPTYKILLWGRGDQTLSCVRLAEKLRQPTLLTVAEWKLGRRLDFSQLPSVADGAVFSPIGATPTLPLTLCMAAGLPVVATPAALALELLKDWQNAVLVARHAPRLFAQSVLEMRTNGGATPAAGTSASNNKLAAFSCERYVDEFRRLYLSHAISACEKP